MADEETTYTDDEDIKFVGLPGRPEIWRGPGGKAYVVFYVPGIEPPIPMVWEVHDEEMLESYFGDEDVVYDAEVTQQEMNEAGALNFGTADEIVLRGENPFAGWVSQFEREMEVLPFLEDPEVAALFASSWLEDRAPTEAELASTDWFKEKTQGEQQWYMLAASSPETAKQRLSSNRLVVNDLMQKAGIDGAPDDFTNYLADQWTTGLWTEAQMKNQIALFADPHKDGRRDQGARELLEGIKLDRTQDRVKYVEDEVMRWLGPKFGKWKNGEIQRWAGRIRNDPDAKDELQAILAQQRMAVLPGSKDNPYREDATYEDIASPWRNFVADAWGTQPDETDWAFMKILQQNDSEQASQLLRTQGLKRGVGKVEEEFLSEISSGFGGSGGVREGG